MTMRYATRSGGFSLPRRLGGGRLRALIGNGAITPRGSHVSDPPAPAGHASEAGGKPRDGTEVVVEAALNPEDQAQVDQLEEQGAIHFHGRGPGEDDDAPTAPTDSDSFTDAREFPHPEFLDPVAQANLEAANANLFSPTRAGGTRGASTQYAPVVREFKEWCKTTPASDANGHHNPWDTTSAVAFILHRYNTNGFSSFAQMERYRSACMYALERSLHEENQRRRLNGEQSIDQPPVKLCQITSMKDLGKKLKQEKANTERAEEKPVLHRLKPVITRAQIIQGSVRMTYLSGAPNKERRFRYPNFCVKNRFVWLGQDNSHRRGGEVLSHAHLGGLSVYPSKKVTTTLGPSQPLIVFGVSNVNKTNQVRSSSRLALSFDVIFLCSPCYFHSPDGETLPRGAQRSAPTTRTHTTWMQPTRWSCARGSWLLRTCCR